METIERRAADGLGGDGQAEERKTSAEAWLTNPDIDEARAVLRGKEAPLPDLLGLARRLLAAKYFGYARQVLDRARRDPAVHADPALRLILCQQHALCTYKDPDLPVASRHDRALAILREVEDLATTQNQETLGLAGAICKRKWEAEGQRADLERALAYYRRGYEQGVSGDDGYTAVNAAFVQDLLAAEEDRQAGAQSEIGRARRADAQAIREEIVRVLAPLGNASEEKGQSWWFLVTVAEACFGLRSYLEALGWLERAKALPDVPDWEYHSTAQQLAALARLQDGECPANDDLERAPAWGVLRRFLGNDLAAVRSSAIGKVGLALSGGGFRASLFHIGVLARLAELDVLRSVEVLSCVSGGSIIGAHYYLEVRKLLQAKRDEDVTREDYIEIVRRIERDFLAGVQENIRTRVAAEWLTNLKMAFWPGYSRTQRVGELYERHLFSRVDDGEGGKERWLNGLFVQPRDGPPKFNPKVDNWRRRAKVPVLVLNATTLNTGHNWQFTASWMGESPFRVDPDVDANEVLRRMYYEEAPPEHRRVRLGHAVAASSCVPGLFEPLVLRGLYPDRAVRLVDGGVHDNQGEAALLEQDCTVLLVSDASGQMGAEADPAPGMLGVLSRTNSVLMARVREAQYYELAARRRAGLLRGLLFAHLRRDLDADPVDWVGCAAPFDATADARPPQRRGLLTYYGIPKVVQERLAAVRTDLDSFTDAEAYALMLSGYRMVEHDFHRCIAGFPAGDGTAVPWRFLEVERAVEARDAGFLRLLDVARSRAFKIWMLSRPLRWTGVALGVAALAALGWLVMEGVREPSYTLTPAGLAAVVLGAVAAALIGKTAVRLVRYRSTLTQVGVGLGMLTVGWLAARLHLHVFDRWYLRWGRLERFE